MKPGQTFTTTLQNGADSEAIYWGHTEDGGILATWCSRHLTQHGFKPEEGPKDSSDPFVIYASDEHAIRLAGWVDGPYTAELEPGMTWVTADYRSSGHIIAVEVDEYHARDEAYNGVEVMTATHLDTLRRALADRAREGRQEPKGAGQPQIGEPVKATLPTAALAKIDAAIGRGLYRSRSQAVRRLVLDALDGLA